MYNLFYEGNSIAVNRIRKFVLLFVQDCLFGDFSAANRITTSGITQETVLKHHEMFFTGKLI